jgi:hypothetical protein
MMNTTIIIILFLLLPAIVIGLFKIIEVRKKRLVRSNLQRTIDELVKNNGLLISETEFFSDKVISIDKRNRKLLFAHFRKQGVKALCLDLRSISFCRVTKAMARFTGEVTEIFLQVKYADTDQLFRLHFYDRAKDDFRTEEALLEKARLWKDKINLYRRPANFKVVIDGSTLFPA